MRVVLWVAGVLIVLGVLAGMSIAFIKSRLETREGKATAVWTQTIEAGDLTEVVSAPGVVEPLTKVEISARVSARITNLPHKEGDSVTVIGDAGPSLLVKLDASDIQAQLESAKKRRDALIAQVAVEEKRIVGTEASLSGTKSVLADMVRELERQQALHRSGDVSDKALQQAERGRDETQARYDAERSSLDAAKLGLVVSRLNIEAAQADIQQINEALSYTTIVTPIDGIVTRLNVDVGEIAITGTMNNPGTVLLEVADLSRMIVVARIAEANIRDVAPGQMGRVRLIAYPDAIFTGRVQSVALAANQQGQYFETKIILDETQALVRTGLSADVEVEVRTHRGVVLVPSQAVVSRPVDGLPADVRKDNPLIDPTRANTIVVFRVTDGKAVATPVTIGASDSLNTVIVEGLDAGTPVVVGPYAVLESLQHDQSLEVARRDGVDVKTTEDRAADTPVDDAAAADKQER